MVKRCAQDPSAAQVIASPGLHTAPVLDMMCSHFVLTLVARQGPKFNVRRDLNSLLAMTGRHLVWPQPVLARPHRLGHSRVPGAPWRVARPL
jgi:hypothetical protein